MTSDRFGEDEGREKDGQADMPRSDVEGQESLELRVRPIDRSVVNYNPREWE